MRNGWLIDAQKIRASSSPPDAFGRTVPELVWRAMHQLGLDAAAVGLDIHLYKLLLYETGGHFVKHLGTSKEPGREDLLSFRSVVLFFMEEIFLSLQPTFKLHSSIFFVSFPI